MSDAIDIAPCCANCRYSVMQDPVMGTCNRYAPRPVTSAEWPEATWWPPVEANHWCGEWALPPTDDELFADYLARSAGILPNLPTFDGIPVLPLDEPAPTAPTIPTYDEPFEDPLR